MDSESGGDGAFDVLKIGFLAVTFNKSTNLSSPLFVDVLSTVVPPLEPSFQLAYC